MTDTTKLKGRILRREVGQLHAQYHSLRRAEFEKIDPDARRQVFEIVQQWAQRFPAEDLMVLRKYGMVDDIQVINVTAWNEATRLWDLRYGFKFPDGQIIPMPGDRWRGTYKSVYTGGDRSPSDSHDHIAELAPFCAEVEARRRIYTAGLADFNAFIDALPLRRDIATRYPDVAEHMLPQWRCAGHAQ